MSQDILLTSFITLFVVIDPVGMAAVFAAMTQTMTVEQRRKTAKRSVRLAAILLVAFAFIGEALLKFLGISLASFRIAGGLMLFLLAIDMVFARPTRRTTPAEDEETEHRQDITVFPLAFPLIAGPGAMTSVVLLMGHAHGIGQILSMLGILVLVLVILLTLLLSAGWVQKALGTTGSNVISRVLGIILAALAVQFVVDGLQTILRG